ncbi:hypothetical protein NQ318_014522 [Aromia moschata]|uniref:Uncharacterized protein n=1 Tax=Aromia moschata TaxID=1265417 RepID=A0AAV8YLK9_9CUCU|nr:hypothetical protein NQ318_014522 [Aromia moschata]
MKRVMPFVQATREKVEQKGVKALALKLDFDEAQVLRNNSIYLANTLDVEEVVIKYTDDKEATEKMKECCPGAPFVLFSTRSGVKVEFVNPVSYNGLFSKWIIISDGDDYAKVAQRLIKDNKAIKKPESLQLWRFVDPVLGDCKLPYFNDPTKDKVLMPPDSIFKVDLDKKKVQIVSGSGTVDIGSQVTYLVV